MNKFDIEMTDERKKEIRKLKQQILKDRFLAISFSPLLFSLILVCLPFIVARDVIKKRKTLSKKQLIQVALADMAKPFVGVKELIKDSFSEAPYSLNSLYTKYKNEDKEKEETERKKIENFDKQISFYIENSSYIIESGNGEYNICLKNKNFILSGKKDENLPFVKILDGSKEYKVDLSDRSYFVLKEKVIKKKKEIDEKRNAETAYENKKKILEILENGNRDNKQR